MSGFLSDFTNMASADKRHMVRLQLENLNHIAVMKRHICPREFFSELSDVLSLDQRHGPYAQREHVKKAELIRLGEPYNSQVLSILASYFDPGFYLDRRDMRADLRLAPPEIRALRLDRDGELVSAGAILNNAQGEFGSKLGKMSNIIDLGDWRRTHGSGSSFVDTKRAVAAPS